MLEEAARCERCGALMAESSAFGGGCPRCMFELGFESDADDALDAVAAGPGALDAGTPAAIARYRIVRLIGEGGMGAVYEAEQDHPRRTVALKIIKPGISNPALLRRFEQESQVLGRLQHPGIAQIYEAGTADTGFGPQPYFAMEFVRGKSLKDYAEAGRLNARDRLTMVSRIAEAAHHAHQRGVIHRDLKPGNVIVDEHGQPKILDFGIARATDSDTQATSQTDVGQLLGTLAYMSPEQTRADPLEIDIRSDVYSLGVILYELLAGRLPFTAKKFPDTIRAIREEEPLRLGFVNRSYRGDIETIVATALEKDMDRRYGSAGELAADIQRYLRDEPIVARPASVLYQLQKFTRRNTALVAGVAAVFVLLVAGIVLINVLRENAVAERNRANANEQLASTNAQLAVAERNRANINAQLASIERDRATSAAQRFEQESATAGTQRDLNLGQSLARASLLESASRVDDDRAGLLARQAMLVQMRTSGQSRSLGEDALQRAAQLDPWTYNLLPFNETDVYGTAYSPDGVYLAAAGSDQEVRVWERQKPWGPPVLLRGHEGPVSSLAFSPDSARLASGGGTDNTVRVWDPRKPGAAPLLLEFTPVVQADSRSAHGRVGAVAFSPDGDHLAAAGFAEEKGPGGIGSVYIVKVWNLRNLDDRPLVLRQTAWTSGLMNRTVSPRGSVAFSPDGKYLACGGGERIVRVWELSKPEHPFVTLDAQQSPNNAVTYSIAFSPDGKQLAAGGGDGTLRLWDLQDPTAPKEEYPIGVAMSLAYSLDGAMLAVGVANGGIAVVPFKAGAPSFNIVRGHQASVNSVALSPDGETLASGGSDKTLRVWDLRNRAVAPTLLLRGSRPPTDYEFLKKTSVAFSPDGARLAAGGPDRTTRVWVLHSLATAPTVFQEDAHGRPVEDLPRPRPRGEPLLIEAGPPLMSLAFSHDGLRLASGGKDNFVRVWDFLKPAASPTRLVGSDGFVDSIAYSADGRYFASGGGSGSSVRVWDLRTPGTVPILLPDSAASYVYSVAISPDSSRIAVALNLFSEKRVYYVVKVWSLRNVHAPVMEFRGHQSFIQSVTFSPDGSRLATGSSDGTVRIWDAHDPKVPAMLLHHPRAVVYSVAFSPDGHRVASASTGAGGVRLFDLRDLSAQPLVFHTLNAISVAFSPDGRHLASGFEDGSVRLWPIWDGAADYLCTRVSRNLSADEWRRYVGSDIPYQRTCPGLPPGPGAR